ncbi:Tumor necrosis factor receptor superfamily member 1B [Liparis tanakae]|uniref:Tumor necrosis factor receptor superfamily member 1B n=1 Tax=Liparis tanakae TaxID=230148 RepID=A0A4Z2EMA2_9TELE|nr:Tumor necrosis factor receptor superfamily member 1B [Liparis tanakae]
MNCSSEDKYTQKDGICCDRCAAGQYMLEECDDTHTTKCVNHQEKVEDCTAQENRVCWCMPGFYCSNYPCDHCWEATSCLLGEGVKVQAAHTNDTLCAPCQDGTYSNVTDSQSACRAHTRCEDFGRVLKTPGTPKADAICGNFKSRRSPY